MEADAGPSRERDVRSEHCKDYPAALAALTVQLRSARTVSAIIAARDKHEASLPGFCWPQGTRSGRLAASVEQLGNVRGAVAVEAVGSLARRWSSCSSSSESGNRSGRRSGRS